MTKREIEMVIEKETKNTYRFKALEQGQPEPIVNVYVYKWFFGTNKPKKIKITIEVIE